MRPNKRLKLAGGDRSKGSGVVVRWRARTIVQRDGARRASRPQLKRDPLDSRQSTSFLYPPVIRAAGPRQLRPLS